MQPRKVQMDGKEKVSVILKALAFDWVVTDGGFSSR